MKSGAQLSHDLIKLVGPFEDCFLSAARIREKMSGVPEIRIHMISAKGMLKLDGIVNSRITLELKTKGPADADKRIFTGTCTSVEFLGASDGFWAYALEVRPWFWMLGQVKDSRIFQNETTIDILRKVCQEMGFTDIEMSLTGTYKPRLYCVQYAETNLDFVTRLLAEEGIYFYVDYKDGKDVLVLADAPSSHKPADGVNVFSFNPGEMDAPDLSGNDILHWSERRRLVGGKVTVVDLDMTKPNTSLLASAAVPTDGEALKKLESYEMNARYSDATAGEEIARRRVESQAAGSNLVRIVANARTIMIGRKIGVVTQNTVGKARSPEYLVVEATHWVQGEVEDYLRNRAGNGIDFVDQVRMPDMPWFAGPYRVIADVAHERVPYRPEVKANAWQPLYGLYRAIVTGPGGEEIYCDDLGRIKVMFPWDQDGTGNEKTSCWVRVAMPWTGAGYGMTVIPRIGQEVLIQFERGDPDYPICTGMVYNGKNAPAEPLPGAMNKTGIKTNSTKGGGGFHELTFDDTKGKEEIKFQSEKDYFQTIKNNATITIGLEKADAGDLTQTIQNHKTETLNKGDWTLNVKTGSRKTTIKTDDILVVTGKSKTTITKDTTVEIKSGNFTETVKKGNYSRTVTKGTDTTTVKKGDVKLVVGKGALSTEVGKGDMSTLVKKGDVNLKVGKKAYNIEVGNAMTTKVKKGDQKTVVSKGKYALTVSTGDAVNTINKGDYTVNVCAGKVTVAAQKKLTLKVGTTKIELTPAGIKMQTTQWGVKATKAEIKADALLNLQGAIGNVKASGILTLKGSLTKIN